MRVAVDAMGGDFAPAEVVRGAVEFLRRALGPDDAKVILVGDETRIRAELATISGGNDARLLVHHASECIGMHEHPTEAIRDKRDASLVVCNALVKSGEAEAAFSAGNTGAMMVASLQQLRRVEGVSRPAIATLMPTETGGYTVVVDAGANVDCRTNHLRDFAILGSVYAEKALGITSPRVGLLNNGEEEGKGNELTREAYTALSALRPRINFIGHVEGNHVFEGRADVVVCDGFVGNVLLKGAEGLARMVLSLLSKEAKAASDETVRNGLLAALLKLRARVDYSEFGGAPLLGVNGVSMIAHGRSDAKAIASGIRIAVRVARSGFVPAMREAVAELQQGAQA